MKGFTFFMKSKDYFIATKRTARTEAFAGEILRRLFLKDNKTNRRELIQKMKKAECEIETLKNGKQIYVIHGEKFRIIDFVGSKNTVVLKEYCGWLCYEPCEEDNNYEILEKIEKNGFISGTKI